MANEIRLEIDARSFLRSLDLAKREFDKAAARALTRVGYDVRDRLRTEAEGTFQLTSRGRALLTTPSAWKVTPAQTASLVATIEARPATAGILAKHAKGGIFGVDADTLAVQGQRAIPIAGLRGASGRVPKRLDPAQLLARGGKGFVRGNVLLQRIGRRSARAVRVLFTLTPKARIPRRFHFEEIARDTARATLPDKLRSEIAKVRLTR